MFFLDSPLVFRRVHSEQGFQTNSINNKMDSFNLLKNILRTKGICFFIDEKKTKNKLSLSFVYLFLAWEYQRDRRDIDNPIPKYILNTSTNEWPSLFNPCLYVSKSLFVFKQLVWRYYDVRKALSFLYKKLKN